MMRDVPARSTSGHSDISVRAVREGFGFVFSSPMIRSTMLLDFFATFFSSATALLPIFAQDVLRVGPKGYGWLYAAPSVGAVLTSFIMVHSIERIERRGVVLLWAVCVYGVATILFGLSHSFWLTFLCLAVDRCRRHREHGSPQCHPPARHARPSPRPHDRNQHGVLSRRPPARRARGRCGGAMAGPARLGRHRRLRMPHRHGLDRGANAGTEALSAQLN